MEERTGSPAEMVQRGADFARALRPGARATIVTLSGNLGAGKTTFVQGVAEALGVQESVSSPTFVLEKVYALEKNPSGIGFTHLIHMDAYRLKSAHELRVLGWEEIIREPGNVIFLEWPERVEGAVPPWATRVIIDIDGEGRIIRIHDGEKDR